MLLSCKPVTAERTKAVVIEPEFHPTLDHRGLFKKLLCQRTRQTIRHPLAQEALQNFERLAYPLLSRICREGDYILLLMASQVFYTISV